MLCGHIMFVPSLCVVCLCIVYCVSGTTPLYSTTTDSNGHTVRSVVGVYGIDLVISNMNSNGAISNADIMSNLAKKATCPSMVISNNTLAYFRDNAASCSVDVETVNYGDGGLFPMEKNKWKYDLLGSFGLLITFGITIAVLVKQALTKSGIVCAVFSGLVVVFQISFGIALVAYTLSTSWNDAIIHKYWKSSNMTVLSTSIDPQICCNVINCQCTEYYGGSSCTSLVDSYTEGYCSLGYYCCETREERCNCDRDGNCQTCTVCVSSVNDRKCESGVLRGESDLVLSS